MGKLKIQNKYQLQSWNIYLKALERDLFIRYLMLGKIQLFDHEKKTQGCKAQIMFKLFMKNSKNFSPEFQPCI